jgi:hypothetical protein
MSTLSESIAAAGITGLRARVLEQIARVPDGVPLGPAPIALARELSAQPADCNEQLTELTNAGLLRVEDRGGERRIVADYAQLGVSAADVEVQKLQAPAFAVLGARGSADAATKLKNDLATSVKPVFLAFDVVDPAELPDVLSRARAGRRTTILIPRKQDVDACPRRPAALADASVFL